MIVLIEPQIIFKKVLKNKQTKNVVKMCRYLISSLLSLSLPLSVHSMIYVHGTP